MEKNAAAIARHFLTLFNCSMLYGSGHPNTVRNAASFAELLNACMNADNLETYSIISYNGALMVEDSPVDRSLNVGKITGHFDRLGLTSVTFERGLDSDGILAFIGLAGDGAVDAVERCRAGLAEVSKAGGLRGVRVNYVQYGKIAADEVVVKADAGGDALFGALPDGGASNVSTGNLSRRAAAQIEQALTLASLLERPKEVSAALAQTDTGSFSVEELHGAFGKIRGEINSSEAHSVSELLESLHNLRTDLYEAIEAQKATGRMMRSAAMLDREINSLTAQAIVKLVREEYRSGKTPLNRLAHTIRRMLPSNTELMGVLPLMKGMLLAEGMDLGAYLELVGMLGLNVESESLSDSLREAADAVGATVGDLVSAIRARPDEAASLLLLASEARAASGGGASGLPELLAGYIEGVCSKMAAERQEAAGGGGGALGKTLARLEAQMYAQLSKRGVPAEALAAVKERLNAGFGGALAAARGALPALPAPGAGGAGGGGAAAGRTAVKMPPEALSANNMLFLLNKELKRSLRYKSPFATLIISIEEVAPCGAPPRRPTPADTAELLPQLFKQAEAMLRDVDTLGMISREEPMPPELFALLPMSGAEGTAAAADRLRKASGEWRFHCGGQRAALGLKVSAVAAGEDTKDLKAYLRAARENHDRASSIDSTMNSGMEYMLPAMP
jgi:hypothetical protein